VEVEECDEFGVVVFRFIADPICEAPGFDALKGTFARETFGTRVVSRRVGVPFETVGAVEVDTTAEAEGGFLAVFAPEAVGFPAVDIAIWVECGDENPVEFLEKLGHGFGFSIGGDKGVGDVVDGACADPFAGMGAASDDDCFAGRRRLFSIGGVDTNTEGRNVTPFVGETNIDNADM